MEPLLLIGALFVIAVALPALWVIANYNRFAQLRQHIEESWSDIDVELKRRYELIPNLMETVKGYAQHERDVFEKVTTMRQQAMASHRSVADQGSDESSLMLAVKRLFAVAEAYPQLQADAHFLSLQQELATTEDRIAAARRFFNGNVRELNTLCQTFPTNLLASMFGFEPASYFELGSDAERVVPRSSFTAVESQD